VFRYLFYTIGDLTYQSPLVVYQYIRQKIKISIYAEAMRVYRHNWNDTKGSFNSSIKQILLWHLLWSKTKFYLPEFKERKTNMRLYVCTLSLSSERGSIIRKFRNSNTETFEYYLSAYLSPAYLPNILVNRHFNIKINYNILHLQD